MSGFRRTGKGGYNALCDICKFKYKADELRRNWKGQMVCKWDWEPRHPKDFYVAIPDTITLPFIRPDTEVERTWTVSGSWTSNEAGTVTVSASYIVNTTSGKTTFKIQIKPAADGISTTYSTGSDLISLPTTAGSAGSFRVFDTTNGGVGYIGSGLIVASDTHITPPAWSLTSNSIIITGEYGT